VHLEWGKVVTSLNWTFVFNLVNFAILLYLLKRLLFKPAIEYLDRRRELVATRMETTRKNEEQAKKLVAERTGALRTAYEQSRRIVEAARVQAEEIIGQGKDDAKKEVERILENARAQIDQEQAEAEHELRRSYAEIAVLGASRVLGREVNLEDHRRLLDDLLSELQEDTLRMKL